MLVLKVNDNWQIFGMWGEGEGRIECEKGNAESPSEAVTGTGSAKVAAAVFLLLLAACVQLSVLFTEYCLYLDCLVAMTPAYRMGRWSKGFTRSQRANLNLGALGAQVKSSKSSKDRSFMMISRESKK